MPTRNTLSARQSHLLRAFAALGGSARSIWELASIDYSGRGHAASYARIHRLAARGFIAIAPRGKSAPRSVTITAKGRTAVGS